MAESRRLKVSEENRDSVSGPVRVITVEGELDLSVVGELEAALGPEAWQGTAGVVVDLRRLGFIDSSGIRSILFAGEEMEATGQGWALLLQPGSPIRQVLRMTELDDRLPIYERYEDALSALGSAGEDGA